MSGLLAGKVCLITGAAAGIGEATAHLFAAQGAQVCVADVNAAGAEAVAGAIGSAALALPMDVRDRAAVDRAAAAALARFGRIDVLVNNAGIYPRRTFLDLTEADWDLMHDVNLKGVFHVTKAVLPHMVARGSGKIVNISSVTFHLGTPNLSHYVATKGGVIGLTRALAREMGPHNIHVNCITPGAIQTEMEKQVATDAQMAEIVAGQCFRRRIQPVEVARVCLFLSSELSDAMTGQTVNVDGGLAMY
ncbi:MAG: SDR family oxidoreductase [Bryobacterales bacterium]|nr:SDR family oxidoreductase [Bryobacterales bacterium]